MATISDTTSYPNIAPVADDYLILTDYNSSLATKTVTVDALSVYLFGNIGGSLIPTIDDTYDIGSPTLQWRNLYIDGIANIDSLSADVGSVITLTVPTSFTTNGTTVFNGAISGTSFITSIALTGASNTNIASTLAIKTYVDTAIATVDDLGGSYDTSTTSVNLPTQSLRILGTANQITTTGDGAQTMQIAFPTNITTPGQFNSGGALVPTANDTYNIGTTGNKWAKLFSTDIADGANSSGTANQVLAKNASNALEWQAQAGGGSMTSWDITDGTTAQTIANGEVVTLAGTTSQITTTQASGTVTFSIPTALTIPGTLSSTGDVIPVTDQLIDLGGDGNRWKTTWTKDIADANDGLGTAAQVLAKNAANTGLEWVNATSGSGTVTSVAATTAGDALDVSVTTPTVAASLEFSFEPAKA